MSEEELVRLTGANGQPEAEMMQQLLQQEGIDVLVQRAPGFDLPQYLAGGPRELYVRREQLEAARAIVASHFGLDDGSTVA
jgi:hypothetical protein